MKFTVLKWVQETFIQWLGRTLELSFRVVLFLLPLGVYMTVLQNRKKVSKVSNISVYTNEHSVWQHVFPGFILVAIDPELFRKFITKGKENFQNWVSSNKYILAFIFMLIIVMSVFWKGN